MNKTYARKAIEQMETYQFGQKKEEHNKLSGVTSFVKKSEALNVIDQLDEPETLSQEWIDERKVDYDNWMPAVPTIHLQNLLVPEKKITVEQAWEVIQGEYGDEVLQNNIDYVESQGYTVIEKPVIPEFVAEWIECSKEIKRVLASAMSPHNSGMPEKVLNWLYDGSGDETHKLFARAWLAWPNVEIEKEKRYRVNVKGLAILAKFYGTVEVYHNSVLNDYDYIKELTEKEIKDYDERFWPFAVPVEELE